MNEGEQRQLAEAIGEINALFSKSLKTALTPIPGQDLQWQGVLKDYLHLQARREYISSTLTRIVNSEEGEEVLELLYQIRQVEREIFELQVAQAEKTSNVDVTSQYSLSNVDLMLEQDPALRRIALANAKKYGRKLLQKWHPDKPNGNEEVFQLCKTAIDSGDVELVHILLYRYGDSNYEAPPEFHPEQLSKKIRMRTTKFQGSMLFTIFAKEARGQHYEFMTSLTYLLKDRLRRLKLAVVPYGTVEPEQEEEPSDASE